LDGGLPCRIGRSDDDIGEIAYREEAGKVFGAFFRLIGGGLGRLLPSFR
jgi:hypothetical protein